MSKLTEKIIQVFFKDEGDAKLGDFLELYNIHKEKDGVIKSFFWLWFQILSSIPKLMDNKIYWGGTMILNYLKITFRNFLRHKTFSLINIFGLAGGICCAFFIYLFVNYNLSYDDYHKDVDRIYNVISVRNSARGQSAGGSHSPLAPYLRENYPQIESAARIMSFNNTAVKNGNQRFKEKNVAYAESETFKIFTIPFLYGNPNKALDEINTVVISDKISEKYFGSKNTVGKTLNIADVDFKITGVFKQLPQNSYISADIYVSFQNILQSEWIRDWGVGMLAVSTFTKLKPNVDPKLFENAISKIPEKFLADELKEKGITSNYKIRKLRSINTVSWRSGAPEDSKTMKNIYIFSAAGFLILLIGIFNFVNLSTARSSMRAKEVGLRKVVGANKKHLVRQFMAESLVLTAISIIIAFFIVILFINQFNEVASTNYTINSIFNIEIFGVFALIGILTGIVSGFYPSIMFSAFSPVEIIQGKITKGNKGNIFRRVLLIAQFCITVFLLITSLSIIYQIDYMKQKDLGFNKEQKMVLKLEHWNLIEDNYAKIKTEFLKIPEVKMVATGSGVPGDFVNRTWYFPDGKEAELGKALRSLRADYDYLDMFEIKLIAGRKLNKEITEDMESKSIIINREAAKQFGWINPEEAVGQSMKNGRIRVAGVVEDFHWWGVQRAIEPFVLRHAPSMFNKIILKADISNLSELINNVKSKYEELFQDDVFEYFFVDTNFELQYKSDENTASIFRLFTGMGIFIACLGLFGIISFIAERKAKEIGIRKVLGSSVNKIIILLSSKLMLWILIANIIAWPCAYYFIDSWLANFEYNTGVNYYLFVIASFATIIIALITLSTQTFKAATKNPVETLRIE